MDKTLVLNVPKSGHHLHSAFTWKIFSIIIITENRVKVMLFNVSPVKYKCGLFTTSHVHKFERDTYFLQYSVDSDHLYLYEGPKEDWYSQLGFPR